MTSVSAFNSKVFQMVAFGKTARGLFRNGNVLPEFPVRKIDTFVLNINLENLDYS